MSPVLAVALNKTVPFHVSAGALLPMLPWIFPGTPLEINGAPGIFRVNLTGMLAWNIAFPSYAMWSYIRNMTDSNATRNVTQSLDMTRKFLSESETKWSPLCRRYFTLVFLAESIHILILASLGLWLYSGISVSVITGARVWPRMYMWGHCDDVIMDAIASQITSLTIVYSIVYSDADQRKHQSSASLAFVR